MIENSPPHKDIIEVDFYFGGKTDDAFWTGVEHGDNFLAEEIRMVLKS